MQHYCRPKTSAQKKVTERVNEFDGGNHSFRTNHGRDARATS